MHQPYVVTTVEWLFSVPGHAEPVSVIRRLKLQGREVFRAVTWAPTSGGRELIGYYPDGDTAAVAVWRWYCDQQAAQHEAASTTHGSHERDGVRISR